MTLKEIYLKSEGKPVLSFEIFPPKNDDDGSKLVKLIGHLNILKKYNPAFISLTYGAGGTNQNLALDMIKKIQNELFLNIMPHFTCVCSTENKVKDYLQSIIDLGIKNILALRGDVPEGMDIKDFDFHYANELVDFIKKETNLSVAVAGYPEGHMECPDIKQDLINLKKKVDAGADAIFTQMFFDNSKFFSFCDKLEKMGIDIPVIPGIMSITSYQQIDKMLSMAKVSLPKDLAEKIEKYKDHPDEIRKTGIDFCIKQCEELISQRVSGLHFYTLNSSLAVSEIFQKFNVKTITKAGN